MDAQLLMQRTLAEALTQSRIRNPSYSLRSFARKLGTSPSALSEILNGKRRVSKKLAARLIDRLNPDPKTAALVLKSFESDAGTEAQEQKETTAPGTRPATYTQLGMDHFNVVADWYHFAILSLAETEDFVGEADWIAMRLGLKKAVAVSALKRLERLGLLKRGTKGRLHATGASYSSPDEIASRAIRRSHAQHLELCLRSLEEHDIHERDFTGITMAIDPAKLPEAKKRIRRFRDELCAFLESDRKTEVYRMNIQLLPLSRRAGKGSREEKK